MKKLFVASTGQNVGKTTICLGLFSGLKKRFPTLGYLKPVGQEWVEAESGKKVDKDVLLFRHHFELKTPLEKMSPVLLPKGFTRDFLDGKIDSKALNHKIEDAASSLNSNALLIEGTGHMGVGSIIDLNNAQVAKSLNSPLVLVVPGGIGNSFDLIALNKALCDLHGVEMAGVILNKVKPEKIDMVQNYLQKALTRWDIPLLGCIPFDALLSTPTLKDFEQLFKTKLISGESKRMSHFEKIRMISTSMEAFQNTLNGDQLIITHATREDIILKILETEGLNLALILTGCEPRAPILNQIKEANLPCLLADQNSYTAMKMITSDISKIAFEDVEKITEAIQLVEANIDFETLFQKL